MSEETLPTLVEQKEDEIVQAIDTRVGELDNTDRDELVGTVREHYKDIVQSLVDAAKGMWVERSVEVKNSKGMPTGLLVRRVYQEKPNTDVGQYLLNQLIGKPKETQVMEGRVTFLRDF